MNIFVLDRNPVKAAQMMCDKHIVKMIIESFQMFSSVIDSNYDPAKLGDDPLLPHQRLGMYDYPKSVPKHKCTEWLTESRGNYKWMLKHTRAMCREYSKRYGKCHKAEGMLMIVEGQIDHLLFDKERRTQFVQAMPDKVKDKNP